MCGAELCPLPAELGAPAACPPPQLDNSAIKAGKHTCPSQHASHSLYQHAHAVTEREGGGELQIHLKDNERGLISGKRRVHGVGTESFKAGR